jgi:cytochrome c551/c552
VKIYFIISLLFLGFATLSLMPDKGHRKQQKEGRALLAQKCYPCHGPSESGQKRLAPPMSKVHQHYYTDGMPREEFVKKVVQFVAQPAKEKAIMPGAIRNFGLMPPPEVTPEELSLIANTLYDYPKLSGKIKHRKKGKGKGACCDKCAH